MTGFRLRVPSSTSGKTTPHQLQTETHPNNGLIPPTEPMIRTACARGFPKPKETFGKLSPGDAYVPNGYAKRGAFIIDLVTRKVTAQ